MDPNNTQSNNQSIPGGLPTAPTMPGDNTVNPSGGIPNTPEQPAMPTSVPPAPAPQVPPQPAQNQTAGPMPASLESAVPASSGLPSAPKGNGKKIALLIIMIILILGMGAYLFLTHSSSKTNNTVNNSIVAPPATVTPTQAPKSIEEVDVASPEADFQSIDNDVSGL